MLGLLPLATGTAVHMPANGDIKQGDQAAHSEQALPSAVCSSRPVPLRTSSRNSGSRRFRCSVPIPVSPPARSGAAKPEQLVPNFQRRLKWSC
jgi:hypothetical protein